MQKLTAEVNLDEEVKHIADFLKQTWSYVHDLESLVRFLRDEALFASRGLFDHYAVWDFAHKLEDQRAQRLAERFGIDTFDVQGYDAVCSLLDSVGGNARELREAGLALDGKWEFERKVRTLTIKVCATDEYQGLKSARPLGWHGLEKGYNDYDGMEEYDPQPDRDLFQGVETAGAHSPAFTGRVALPYVMYDEKCQNRKACEVLVGAVFAHFSHIAEYLNTQRLCEALKESLLDFESPEMVFQRRLKTANPFLKVFFEVARPCWSRADFEASQVQRKVYEALPEEEKEALKAKNSEYLLELVEGIKTDLNGSRRKKQEEGELEKVALLRTAFKVRPIP